MYIKYSDEPLLPVGRYDFPSLRHLRFTIRNSSRENNHNLLRDNTEELNEQPGRPVEDTLYARSCCADQKNSNVDSESNTDIKLHEEIQPQDLSFATLSMFRGMIESEPSSYTSHRNAAKNRLDVKAHSLSARRQERGLEQDKRRRKLPRAVIQSRDTDAVSTKIPFVVQPNRLVECKRLFLNYAEPSELKTVPELKSGDYVPFCDFERDAFGSLGEISCAKESSQHSLLDSFEQNDLQSCDETTSRQVKSDKVAEFSEIYRLVRGTPTRLSERGPYELARMISVPVVCSEGRKTRLHSTEDIERIERRMSYLCEVVGSGDVAFPASVISPLFKYLNENGINQTSEFYDYRVLKSLMFFKYLPLIENLVDYDCVIFEGDLLELVTHVQDAADSNWETFVDFGAPDIQENSLSISRVFKTDYAYCNNASESIHLPHSSYTTEHRIWGFGLCAVETEEQDMSEASVEQYRSADCQFCSSDLSPKDPLTEQNSFNFISSLEEIEAVTGEVQMDSPQVLEARLDEKMWHISSRTHSIPDMFRGMTVHTQSCSADIAYLNTWGQHCPSHEVGYEMADSYHVRHDTALTELGQIQMFSSINIGCPIDSLSSVGILVANFDLNSALCAEILARSLVLPQLAYEDEYSPLSRLVPLCDTMDCVNLKQNNMAEFNNASDVFDKLEVCMTTGVEFDTLSTHWIEGTSFQPFILPCSHFEDLFIVRHQAFVSPSDLAFVSLQQICEKNSHYSSVPSEELEYCLGTEMNSSTITFVSSPTKSLELTSVVTVCESVRHRVIPYPVNRNLLCMNSLMWCECNNAVIYSRPSTLSETGYHEQTLWTTWFRQSCVATLSGFIVKVGIFGFETSDFVPLTGICLALATCAFICLQKNEKIWYSMA